MNDGTDEAPLGVVVGLDGSENASRAALWAAREALSRAVPLTVLSAFNLPDANLISNKPSEYVQHRRAESAALLKPAAETLHTVFPELVINTELSDFSPARTLAGLGARSDLLMTGTRGLGGFTGMLLGSVTRKVAAHATRPPTVVRGEQPETVLKSYSESARGRSNRSRRSPTRSPLRNAMAPLCTPCALGSRSQHIRDRWFLLHRFHGNPQRGATRSRATAGAGTRRLPRRAGRGVGSTRQPRADSGGGGARHQTGRSRSARTPRPPFDRRRIRRRPAASPSRPRAVTASTCSWSADGGPRRSTAARLSPGRATSSRNSTCSGRQRSRTPKQQSHLSKASSPT